MAHHPIAAYQPFGTSMVRCHTLPGGRARPGDTATRRPTSSSGGALAAAPSPPQPLAVAGGGASAAASFPCACGDAALGAGFEPLSPSWLDCVDSTSLSGSADAACMSDRTKSSAAVVLGPPPPLPSPSETPPSALAACGDVSRGQPKYRGGWAVAAPGGGNGRPAKHASSCHRREHATHSRMAVPSSPHRTQSSPRLASSPESSLDSEEVPSSRSTCTPKEGATKAAAAATRRGPRVRLATDRVAASTWHAGHVH